MIRIFLVILIFNFLTGCQPMKEGLTLQKQRGADEFLVEKKNPLVQPPEFGKLPTPTDPNIDENDNDENNIEELLGLENTNQQSIEFESSSNNIEENILEKIKNQ